MDAFDSAGKRFSSILIPSADVQKHATFFFLSLTRKHCYSSYPHTDKLLPDDYLPPADNLHGSVYFSDTEKIFTDLNTLS